MIDKLAIGQEVVGTLAIRPMVLDMRTEYALNMPSEDVRKTANWDSLLDTDEVKIATLICNTYNCITPSCLDHIIQRKESKYDLRHQHPVSLQQF